MPLYIVKKEITEIKCDARVNIKIITCDRETRNITVLKSDDAISDFIIDVNCSIKKTDEEFPKAQVKAIYEYILMETLVRNFDTISFPCTPFGVDQSKLYCFWCGSVEAEVFGKFLLHNEKTIYIAAPENVDFNVNKSFFETLKNYVDDTYWRSEKNLKKPKSGVFDFCQESKRGYFINLGEKYDPDREIKSELEKLLSEMGDDFTNTLLKLIKLKGMTEVECYKRANVSRQTWYKIINDKNYKPSKNTVISFSIALKLSYDDAAQLLSSAGFCLSNGNRFDVIIKYFLLSRKYDIFAINETLFAFGEPCLGV